MRMKRSWQYINEVETVEIKFYFNIVAFVTTNLSWNDDMDYDIKFHLSDINQTQATTTSDLVPVLKFLLCDRVQTW